MKVEKKMMLLVGLVFITTISFGEVNSIFGEVLPEGNQIHWTTESQEDVDFFIIQRSKDGLKFFPIAMVPTKGDTKDYAFMDEKVGDNNWFYRVVDVDNQGVGEYTSALFLEYAYVSKDLESTKPPTNITINDHIATKMNCWLTDLEFPTISKLGMAANFKGFPNADKLGAKK